MKMAFNKRRIHFGQIARSRVAFTLIEIMVVVAIMAVVLTMSVPIIYRTFHKEALRKAVTDVIEVCSNARARAILQGSMTEVVWHPKEQRLEVSGGNGAQVATHPSANVEVGNAAPTASGLSAQIPNNIIIRMLAINLVPDYEQAEVAHVRFYPNGTCDEMVLILQSDQNEQRGISLEVTTSLATVLYEADLQKLRNGRL
jgi:prepilin-type N-terminal cleavage/methylation domain-containing protein